MSVEEEEVVWRWGMDEYTFVYESSYSRDVILVRVFDSQLKGSGLKPETLN